MTSIIGAPCCDKCQFSHEENGQLQCRRVWPTVFAVAGPDGIHVGSAFPNVQKHWLCGEFKRCGVETL